MGRKLPAISRRVNSGHPLFIGEGRTGESPFIRTTKTQTEPRRSGWVFRYEQKGLEWGENCLQFPEG